MRAISIRKYEHINYDYPFIPKEDMCKVPLLMGDSERLLFGQLYYKPKGQSDMPVGYVVASCISKSSKILHVFTTTGALLSFIYSSVKQPADSVMIHNDQVDSSIQTLLERFWTIKNDSVYAVVHFRRKVSQQEIEALLDELDVAGINQKPHMMKCVMTSHKWSEVVLATVENVDWFNKLLLRNQSNGYILLDPDIPNYGHILHYIISFEHSTLELSKNKSGIRAYLISKLLMLNEEFPRTNEKRGLSA